MSDANASLELKYKTRFGSEPLIIRAPGRINIIGEHTDYNDGFVLPASINKCVTVLIGRSHSSICTLLAVDLEEEYSFSIDDELHKVDKGWVNYFIGVLAGLKENYTFSEGFHMMFSSDIPIGSGLSSSAAIEVGFGYALSCLFNLDVDRISLAKIGQKAEHNFAGVQCGIMDQFAVAMGKKNRVIQLDCRSLDYQYYPADFGEYELVLFDTQVKHNLASSQYNIRRQQCEEGVTAVKSRYNEVNALRDVSMEMLDEIKDNISQLVYQRCSYVIKENNRVVEVCNALAQNNLDQVGKLMYQTHHGLKNDYNVSCEELDNLVDLAQKSGKVIGARMMGGGFGGCTINLIKSAEANTIINQIASAYHQRTNKEMKVYRVQIEEGVHQIK